MISRSSAHKPDPRSVCLMSAITHTPRMLAWVDIATARTSSLQMFPEGYALYIRVHNCFFIRGQIIPTTLTRAPPQKGA